VTLSREEEAGDTGRPTRMKEEGMMRGKPVGLTILKQNKSTTEGKFSPNDGGRRERGDKHLHPERQQSQPTQELPK